MAQNDVVIDGVIAVVGSEILLKSDLEKNIIQYKTQGVFVDEAVRCQVFEDLLFQKLLINQSKLDSIEITEQQLDQELGEAYTIATDAISGNMMMDEAREGIDAFIEKRSPVWPE